MSGARPFADRDAIFEAAEAHWASCERDDILEAFSHHPKIGENLDALREKFGSTADWSAQEQQGMASADEGLILSLRDANRAYDAKFGFIFIICATGKSADEMLAAIQSRLSNDAATELRVAAGEQAKITRLRLEKLLS